MLFCSCVNCHGKTQANTKSGSKASSGGREGNAYDDRKDFLKDLKNPNRKLKTQWK